VRALARLLNSPQRLPLPRDLAASSARFAVADHRWRLNAGQGNVRSAARQ